MFPLGDMAAVCGFEAFINGKHIVGEVKEKEKAHKEYKKAISEGHGAYLMDQDKETPVSHVISLDFFFILSFTIQRLLVQNCLQSVFNELSRRTLTQILNL